MARTHIKGSQVALKCALPFLSATSLPDKTILWQLIWFCRLIQNRHICPFYLCNFNTVTLWTCFRELESTWISQRVLGEVEMMGELSHSKTDRTTCFCGFKIWREGGRRGNVIILTSNAVQPKLDYTAWSEEVSPRHGNQGARGKKRSRTHHSISKSAPAIEKELWCSVWHSTCRLILIILITSFGFHIFTLTQKFQFFPRKSKHIHWV